VEPLGSPDGMKVDVEGNLYITGGGGLWVVDPAGRHLGTIPFPELPANLAFGDDDLRSIYVTARTSIYRLRINVPGIRVL
jgi:gluconolactonase